MTGNLARETCVSVTRSMLFGENSARLSEGLTVCRVSSLLAANALPGRATAPAMTPIPRNHCRRLIILLPLGTAIFKSRIETGQGLRKWKVYNRIRKLTKHDGLWRQTTIWLCSRLRGIAPERSLCLCGLGLRSRRYSLPCACFRLETLTSSAAMDYEHLCFGFGGALPTCQWRASMGDR